ncbi:UDP-N-acetylmuramate--L-alanine ligase [Thermodesulfatator autotrophicus]|uniref:UDP-N-acetylmuramate:L-alanyl-gamma-D-glutamyl-meso-diaminopimelate ligase n=1 Tax=Thermodesulfatator autotrophicus TaxID=1795632 RepID=A0A177E6G1_9BACT|nr:Mur ligase family protein [Thermodesulfatator autotrophicus]OAG27485.1 hypothetical protein TH606_06650 [Thermodesulfatator autotrophicus]
MIFPKKVYLIGIGGVGMGALAGLFKASGVEVSGSEKGSIYPPMSILLDELGISYSTNFNPENIRAFSPDLVVVGNVARFDNPEVKFVLENKIPYLSLPEALYGFFIGCKKSLVVVGTHGKTTTSALLAYVLERLGEDPTFFIGGLRSDNLRNFCFGQGKFIVLEGDEYDSAFFDKRPKFVHYAPFGAILTSVEFDHADIYADFSALKETFKHFISLICPKGFLSYAADEKEVIELARFYPGEKISYGEQGDLKLIKREPLQNPPGQRITFSFHGLEDEFFLPLIGEHNALNALGVWALLLKLGFKPEKLKKAFADFPGTKRRQEILLEKPITIIDDFAHHPTAVEVTIKAVKETWPGRRLIAVFEPRTNTSRRKIFQKDYARVLSLADAVYLKVPADLEKVPAEERLDLKKLAQEISYLGISVSVSSDYSGLLQVLKEEVRPDDVVLFMSNASFGNVPEELVKFCLKNLIS